MNSDPRRRLLPLAVLTAALNLVACLGPNPPPTSSFEPPEPSTPAPATSTPTTGPGPIIGRPPTGVFGLAEIHHPLVASDIDMATGDLIGVGTAFPAGTSQLLVGISWDSWSADDVSRSIDVRLSRSAAENILIEVHHDVVDLGSNGDAGFIVVLLSPGGFAVDHYQVELIVNGQPDQIAAFSIGDVPSPGVTIGSGEASGTIGYKDPTDVLVITRSSVLRNNLGETNTNAVLAAAGAVGVLHDLDENPATAAGADAAGAFVKDLLRAGGYHYLLIVGNDDAVPFFHVDNPLEETEIDWKSLEGWDLPYDWLPSDDPYADLDGDQWGTPDLAVARIPSSDDAELILTQLGDNITPDGHGHALINQRRGTPGETVVDAMATAVGVEVEYAPPANAESFGTGSADDARYLYMLAHGIGVLTDEWSYDAQTWTAQNAADPFQAEWTVKGGQGAAVSIANNPVSRGVVAVGACYGAWTLDTTSPDGPKHKDASNNLALHYLKSGTRAFVGDTHLSYSSWETQVPLSGRTGFEKVFWGAVSQGVAPIDAFQQAKVAIAQAIEEQVAARSPFWANTNLKTLHYMVYFGRP